MINNRVLIFYHYGPGINGGGPMGFVNQNIEGVISKYFATPNQLHASKIHLGNQVVRSFRSRIDLDWDIKKDLLKSNITDQLIWSRMLKTAIRRFKEIKAHQYKYIYFHDIFTLKACLHLLGSEQVVIFQPHSPEQMSEETQYISSEKHDYIWAQKAEKDAFKRVNVIVLPNEHVLPIYKDLINESTTVKYLLSGCGSHSDVRTYPLPEDKINLLYIGRRIKIKGFDLLLEAFKKVRETRKDINLLILGNGEKISDEGLLSL